MCSNKPVWSNARRCSGAITASAGSGRLSHLPALCPQYPSSLLIQSTTTISRSFFQRPFTKSCLSHALKYFVKAATVPSLFLAWFHCGWVVLSGISPRGSLCTRSYNHSCLVSVLMRLQRLFRTSAHLIWMRHKAFEVH